MISCDKRTLSLISFPKANAPWKGDTILFKRGFTLLANI